MWRGQLGVKNPVWIEAHIDVRQSKEAPHHECCAQEQSNRQRNLCDDQTDRSLPYREPPPVPFRLPVNRSASVPPTA